VETDEPDATLEVELDATRVEVGGPVELADEVEETPERLVETDDDAVVVFPLVDALDCIELEADEARLLLVLAVDVLDCFELETEGAGLVLVLTAEELDWIELEEEAVGSLLVLPVDVDWLVLADELEDVEVPVELDRLLL
jgi:hypothetical protein